MRAPTGKSNEHCKSSVLYILGGLTLILENDFMLERFILSMGARGDESGMEGGGGGRSCTLHGLRCAQRFECVFCRVIEQRKRL